jgi:hypothetical protein
VADHTIRHQGYTKKVVKEAVYNIVEDMPKVYNSIDRFQDIKLDADQKHAFGRASLTFAYTDEQLEELDIDDTANRLMRPYRTEERDNTLWNAFNIAQEKLIRGGRFLSDKDSYRPKKKRATKDITKNVNINRALWAFTEAIADKLS